MTGGASIFILSLSALSFILFSIHLNPNTPRAIPIPPITIPGTLIPNKDIPETTFVTTPDSAIAIPTSPNTLNILTKKEVKAINGNLFSVTGSSFHVSSSLVFKVV